MMNQAQSAVEKEARIVWPDLTKDHRALALAKVAMGWADMTTEQQMANARQLTQRAQEIKATL